MNIYRGDVCDTSELVTRRTASPSTALVQHDSRLEGSSGRMLILILRVCHVESVWKFGWVGMLVLCNPKSGAKTTVVESAQL